MFSCSSDSHGLFITICMLRCTCIFLDLFLKLYIFSCLICLQAAPSFVRLFQYPNFSSVLANKSFFKAEKADIKWNKKGTFVLFFKK